MNDGKRIWKGIKQIIRTTSQERQAINRVVLNDIEITDPTSIANAFNNYFPNIGSDLASAIPSVVNSAYEWMLPPPRDSFFLSPISKVTGEKPSRSLRLNRLSP